MKLDLLKQIGFVQAGECQVDHETISVVCTVHESATNVLYGFVVDDEVVYVGKTVQPLCKRMQQYRTPSQTQRTNWRNRIAIMAALKAGSRVTIWVLPDSGLIRYGPFHLNLAAGLEDSIIRDLKPIWNGGQKELI